MRRFAETGSSSPCVRAAEESSKASAPSDTSRIVRIAFLLQSRFQGSEPRRPRRVDYTRSGHETECNIRPCLSRLPAFGQLEGVSVLPTIEMRISRGIPYFQQLLKTRSAKPSSP